MLRTAILGAAGYTGAELLRIVHRHPELELVMVAARDNAGKRLGDVLPSTLGVAASGDRVLESFEPDAAPETSRSASTSRSCACRTPRARARARRFSKPGFASSISRPTFG